MAPSRLYRLFRIEIRPSPNTNDHEVRFFGDGEDLIAHYWNDMIGLDPDDILVRPCPVQSAAEAHRATVARCNCGVKGCGSIEVDVARSQGNVEWTWGSPISPEKLTFLANSYDEEVERALTDTSWETPDRTAARLLAGMVDRQRLSLHGLSFCWASGRLRKGTFSVSLTLEPGPYQLLVHLPWNAESPERIARKCAELLAQQPTIWAQVEWFPQQSELGPPLVVGAKLAAGRQLTTYISRPQRPCCEKCLR